MADVHAKFTNLILRIIGAIIIAGGGVANSAKALDYVIDSTNAGTGYSNLNYDSAAGETLYIHTNGELTGELRTGDWDAPYITVETTNSSGNGKHSDISVNLNARNPASGGIVDFSNLIGGIDLKNHNGGANLVEITVAGTDASVGPIALESEGGVNQVVVHSDESVNGRAVALTNSGSRAGPAGPDELYKLVGDNRIQLLTRGYSASFGDAGGITAKQTGANSDGNNSIDVAAGGNIGDVRAIISGAGSTGKNQVNLTTRAWGVIGNIDVQNVGSGTNEVWLLVGDDIMSISSPSTQRHQTYGAINIGATGGTGKNTLTIAGSSVEASTGAITLGNAANTGGNDAAISVPTSGAITLTTSTGDNYLKLSVPWDPQNKQLYDYGGGGTSYGDATLIGNSLNTLYVDVGAQNSVAGAAFDNANSAARNVVNAVSGAIGNLNLTAANGANELNFYGGYIDDTTDLTAAAGRTTLNYHFDHDQYDANHGSPILTLGAAETNIDTLKINLIGGNGYHELINLGSSSASLTALAQQINDNSTTLVKSYHPELINGDKGLRVHVGANASGIRGATDAGAAADAIIQQVNLDSAFGKALGQLAHYQGNGAATRAIQANNQAHQASAVRRNASEAARQFNAAFGQALVDNFLDNFTVASPLSRAAAGGTPRFDGGITAFAKFYGGFGAQDRARGADVGYDFGSFGVLNGLGYRFSRELEIGLLTAYAYHFANLRGNFGDNHDNVLRLGLYGNYTWDNFYFHSAPTAGIHFLKNRRADGFGGFATSDRTGVDFSWQNRIGYRFELPDNFYLAPAGSLALTYFHDPRYAERGSIANQNIGEQNYWSLLQTLELRAGKLWRFGENFAILPEIWGGWEHEYHADYNAEFSFAFPGSSSYQINVETPGDDRALIGAGVRTLVGGGAYEIYGRYDERLWNGGHSSQFTVGMIVKF